MQWGPQAWIHSVLSFLSFHLKPQGFFFPKKLKCSLDHSVPSLCAGGQCWVLSGTWWLCCQQLRIRAKRVRLIQRSLSLLPSSLLPSPLK